MLQHGRYRLHEGQRRGWGTLSKNWSSIVPTSSHPLQGVAGDQRGSVLWQRSVRLQGTGEGAAGGVRGVVGRRAQHGVLLQCLLDTA
jgi:hypothetical protein